LWINVDKACDKQINNVLTVSSHKVFDLANVLVFEMHFMTLDGLLEFVGGRLSVSVIIVGWYHFTTEWSVQQCDVVTTEWSVQECDVVTTEWSVQECEIVISVILWKPLNFVCAQRLVNSNINDYLLSGA